MKETIFLTNPSPIVGHCKRERDDELGRCDCGWYYRHFIHPLSTTPHLSYQLDHVIHLCVKLFEMF